MKFKYTYLHLPTKKRGVDVSSKDYITQEEFLMDLNRWNMSPDWKYTTDYYVVPIKVRRENDNRRTV